MLTTSQAQAMTDDQIIAHLQRAALFQREHKAITWEHGADLVTIVAVHGDRIAKAMTAQENPPGWQPGVECEHGYDACPICDK